MAWGGKKPRRAPSWFSVCLFDGFGYSVEKGLHAAAGKTRTSGRPFFLVYVAFHAGNMLLNDRRRDEPSMPSISGLELQEKIGEGGMGMVYQAMHLNLQRSVAVKVLRASADEGTAPPAWQRESRLMASLAHPNVVTIYDAGQIDGHNYLVLEYMAGGSLRSRMTPGRPWPLAEAIPVLDRIAQALCHIHGQGVLHRTSHPRTFSTRRTARSRSPTSGCRCRTPTPRGFWKGAVSGHARLQCPRTTLQPVAGRPL